MTDETYEFGPEQSSAILHAMAAGRLPDNYSTEEYLAAIELARLENPEISKRAFPSAHRAEAEQFRRLRETKGEAS